MWTFTALRTRVCLYRNVFPTPLVPLLLSTRGNSPRSSGIPHNEDLMHRFSAQIQSFASDLAVKNDSSARGDNVKGGSEER